MAPPSPTSFSGRAWQEVIANHQQLHMDNSHVRQGVELPALQKGREPHGSGWFCFWRF